ncbi:MAG: sodium-dependent transporter [Planctomycetota bacterium]
MTAPKEQWATRLGVILAVAGSAVGLGNFLRFPAQAAQNGGGVFMIPYFCALLLLGLPICWAEWTMGKAGGRLGKHSCPAILGRIGGSRAWHYIGALGLLMPTIVYLYYVVIESWCLAYAWSYLVGDVDLGAAPSEFGQRSAGVFTSFSGDDADGLVFAGELHLSVWFWMFTVLANFALIYRGITKGIEKFCNIAMPIMLVCALVVLVRVLTLPPFEAGGETRTVLDGLGFMWSPKPAQGDQSAWEALANPKVWLAAAGQIFFTLSVGFGVIVNYASYLKPKDDAILSGTTAAATNEFFEVCLGGLITIPAAFLFLGIAGASKGTFGLGFNTLPIVFEYMPAGRLFGFLWFFMLFLAAITSSLSLLQPVIAFLEEGLNLSRRGSVTLLCVLTVLGNLFVLYFSKGLAALDTLDFWAAEVGILVFGTLEVILLAWFFGARRGHALAAEGAELHPPRWVYTVLMRFVTPMALLTVLVAWCYFNAGDRVKTLKAGGVPAYAIGVIVALLLFYLVLAHLADRRWRWEGARGFPVIPTGEAEVPR